MADQTLGKQIFLILFSLQNQYIIIICLQQTKYENSSPFNLDAWLLLYENKIIQRWAKHIKGKFSNTAKARNAQKNVLIIDHLLKIQKGKKFGDNIQFDDAGGMIE